MVRTEEEGERKNGGDDGSSSSGVGSSHSGVGSNSGVGGSRGGSDSSNDVGSSRGGGGSSSSPGVLFVAVDFWFRESGCRSFLGGDQRLANAPDAFVCGNFKLLQTSVPARKKYKYGRWQAPSSTSVADSMYIGLLTLAAHRMAPYTCSPFIFLSSIKPNPAHIRLQFQPTSSPTSSPNIQPISGSKCSPHPVQIQPTSSPTSSPYPAPNVAHIQPTSSPTFSPHPAPHPAHISSNSSPYPAPTTASHPNMPMDPLHLQPK